MTATEGGGNRMLERVAAILDGSRAHAPDAVRHDRHALRRDAQPVRGLAAGAAAGDLTHHAAALGPRTIMVPGLPAWHGVDGTISPPGVCAAR